MTIKALLYISAAHNKIAPEQHAHNILLLLLERLPITTMSDIVAHMIATDEDGDSEAASDLVHAVGKERWGTDEWEAAMQLARHRYDPEYTPDAYTLGYKQGQHAARSAGGSRGAEWHADQQQLEGVKRADYIQGYNDGQTE